MNENQNRPWTSEDDAKLIINRHKGIDFLREEFSRSRKAIKSRFVHLQKTGEIDKTVILLQDEARDISEGLGNVESIAEMGVKAMDLSKDLMEWAAHIINTYEIEMDDVELMYLIISKEEEMV